MICFELLIENYLQIIKFCNSYCFREMTENNEQHDIEIDLMRVTVEGGAKRSTEDIIECFDGEFNVFTF